MEQALEIIKRKHKSYVLALKKMAEKIRPEILAFEGEVVRWYKGFGVFMEANQSWVESKRKTSPMAAFKGKGSNSREIEKATLLLGKTIDDTNNFLDEYTVFTKKYIKFNKDFDKHATAMEKNNAYYKAGKFDNPKKAQKTMDLFDEMHDFKKRSDLINREQRLLMKRFQKLQSQLNILKGKN